MLSPVRRIFIAIVFSAFVSLILVPHIFAQTSPANSSTSINTQAASPNVENVAQNQSTWIQSTMINVMGAMSCQLSGINPADLSHPCIGVNTNTQKLGYAPSNTGLFGLVINGIGVLYTPTIRLGDYTNYLASNFSIVKPSFAASTAYCADPHNKNTGFCGLSPFFGIWTSIRNFAYLGFVFIFIIIGFAIMLRLKLRAQTVITIQNAIPRIIIGLILITFSFAIAGFLIDLMYVIIAVLINLAVSIDPLPKGTPGCIYNIIYGGSSNGSPSFGGIQGNNPLGFFNMLFTTNSGIGSVGGTLGVSWQVANGFGNTFGDLISSTGTGGQIVVGLLASLFSGIVGSNLASIPGKVPLLGGLGIFSGALGLAIPIIGGIAGGVYASNLAAFVGTIIGFIIILIAIITSLIRVWFILLKSYILILLDVIFSPVWILASILPNSKYTFGAWLRDLCANLSVFPTIIGLLLTAKVFINAFAEYASNSEATHTTGPIFAPPLLGTNISATSSLYSSITPLIGLTFVLLAPHAINYVRAIFKAPQPSLFNNALQSLGVGMAAGKGLWGQTGGRFFGEKGPGRWMYGEARKERKAAIAARGGTLPQKFGRSIINKTGLSPYTPGAKNFEDTTINQALQMFREEERRLPAGSPRLTGTRFDDIVNNLLQAKYRNRYTAAQIRNQHPYIEIIAKRTKEQNLIP